MTASARWRGGPHAFISTQAPAPKKKTRDATPKHPTRDATPKPGMIPTLTCACLACTRSKVKCDKCSPCGRCVRLGLRCVETDTTLDPLVALAMALGHKHNARLVLACVGRLDRRWDGSRPIPKAFVPEVACGYPKGTHEGQIGKGLFQNFKPSAKGVHTFPKINYKPLKKGQHHEKTGEVHYRLVEESDVEAIKKAFPDLAF